MSNELNTVAPVAPAPALSFREQLQQKLLAMKAAEAAAQASKPTTNASKPTAPVGRMLDAFGSSPQVGTGMMHSVLAEAYAEGYTLTPKQIAELINFVRPVPGHLNTMSGRGRAISDGRGNWRLTDAAGQHWHGEGKAFGFAKAEREAARIEAEKQAAEAARIEAEKQAAEAEAEKGKGKKGK